MKFYRGLREFYRYSPSEVPSSKIFPFPGIHVDVSLIQNWKDFSVPHRLMNFFFSLSSNRTLSRMPVKWSYEMLDSVWAEISRARSLRTHRHFQQLRLIFRCKWLVSTKSFVQKIIRCHILLPLDNARGSRVHGKKVGEKLFRENDKHLDIFVSAHSSINCWLKFPFAEFNLTKKFYLKIFQNYFRERSIDLTTSKAMVKWYCGIHCDTLYRTVEKKTKFLK